jgi:activator of HSP90 ATPase
VAYENNDKRMESIYSKRIRAGKRRTYFFDVRATRGNDYYLTITESRKKFNADGYDRHKIFLYKEDFNKFIKALNEAVDYVKTELMPDFDFDAYNHDQVENESEDIAAEVETGVSHAGNGVTTTTTATATAPAASTSTVSVSASAAAPAASNSSSTEEVDKW